MKLIDLHKQWCESGKFSNRPTTIGIGGLCNAVPSQYLSDLEEFKPDLDKPYWASTKPEHDTSHSAIYGYNVFRQTIVLLICAMNGEL